FFLLTDAEPAFRHRPHCARRRASCVPPFGMALRALIVRFKMAAVNRFDRQATAMSHRPQRRKPAMTQSRLQVSILGLGAAVLLATQNVHTRAQAQGAASNT